MKRRTFLLANLAGAACAALGIKVAEAKPKVATEILICVDGKPIGAVENITISETVGKPLKIKTGRIRFDNLRIQEAFHRGFVHISAQTKPVQFEVKEHGKRMFMTPKVWFSKMNACSYKTSDFTILAVYGPSDPPKDPGIELKETRSPNVVIKS